MLQTFLPLCLMTFVICLFIFFMQFFWRYMEEVIGKGLDTSIIIELFSYAAISLVPQSLPIAILLASLMTFGNLGESFELISMKAAGISLLQIMKPLIIFMVFVCFGVFAFQDKVIPETQKRMYALLLSVKRKTPELEIPVGSFYKQIEGYNLYVKHKDPETGRLDDLMVYDFSGGFDNATVILADSGYLKTSADKQSLVFYLYHGELFENMKKQRAAKENVPYRRETFEEKTILISFDGSFNRMDDSSLDDQHVSKNREQLRHTVDSLKVEVDSLKNIEANYLVKSAYFQGVSFDSNTKQDTTSVADATMSFDSIFDSFSYKKRAEIISNALSKSEMTRSEIVSRNYETTNKERIMRRHAIEWHRKYTLSLACIIFFFIGAPLGAIIRKGGLGMPVVISVFLFLFYHIIDNTNYKMARDGVIPIIQGTWTSSVVLLGLGIFFTYKAINDSTILNADTYVNFIKRLFGKRPVRDFEKKELIIYEADYNKVLNNINLLDAQCASFLQNRKFPNYIEFWRKDDYKAYLQEIIDLEEGIVKELVNADDYQIIKEMNAYPIIPSQRNFAPFKNDTLNKLTGIIFPIGLVWYLQAWYYEKRADKDLKKILIVNKKIKQLLSEE